MKIKEGFELREICGEQIILSHGMENIDFTKIISLNETAAFLWNKAVGKDFDKEMLTHAVQEVYEVDEAIARADVERIVEQWRQSSLLE